MIIGISWSPYQVIKGQLTADTQIIRLSTFSSLSRPCCKALDTNITITAQVKAEVIINKI